LVETATVAVLVTPGCDVPVLLGIGVAVISARVGVASAVFTGVLLATAVFRGVLLATEVLEAMGVVVAVGGVPVTVDAGVELGVAVRVVVTVDGTVVAVGAQPASTVMVPVMKVCIAQ
jgi:hypothetical protein